MSKKNNTIPNTLCLFLSDGILLGKLLNLPYCNTQDMYAPYTHDMYAPYTAIKLLFTSTLFHNE